MLYRPDKLPANHHPDGLYRPDKKHPAYIILMMKSLLYRPDKKHPAYIILMMKSLLYRPDTLNKHRADHHPDS